MNEPEFERYVLDLLFVALEPFVGNRSGWESTPVVSLLPQSSLSRFYEMTEALFTRLVSLNGPRLLAENAARKQVSGILTSNKNGQTPRSLVELLADTILSNALGRPQQQQQQIGRAHV